MFTDRSPRRHRPGITAVVQNITRTRRGEVPRLSTSIAASTRKLIGIKRTTRMSRVRHARSVTGRQSPRHRGRRRAGGGGGPGTQPPPPRQPCLAASSSLVWSTLQISVHFLEVIRRQRDRFKMQHQMLCRPFFKLGQLKFYWPMVDHPFVWSTPEINIGRHDERLST